MGGGGFGVLGGAGLAAHSSAVSTRRVPPPALRTAYPGGSRPSGALSPRANRGGELADTPGSVGAAPKHNAGDHSSRAYVAVSLKRSTRRWGASSSSLLLDLAPGGVYLASQVTLAAGALLPHRFTLTASSPRDEGVAVCFLWHFPAGYPGWLLATTLL